MIRHLATLFVNLNKTYDARHAYGRLMIKLTQTFAEFQTLFLQLAGEGDVPAENLRFDLYDKLTPLLQDRLAAVLEDLDSYDKLARRCLTTDTELKRVNTRLDRQERLKEKKNTVATKPIGTYFTARETTEKPLRTIPTSENRRSTTPSASTSSENCFNCGKAGHYARECTESKRTTELKDIEEGSESGKEYA